MQENKLTRMLFKLQQISLIFTCLSNETQPRRNQRLSGCGSAMATRKNPGNRLHIYSINIINIDKKQRIVQNEKCELLVLKNFVKDLL